jgi:Zn-dependent peptidase ImmA (M78 family)
MVMQTHYDAVAAIASDDRAHWMGNYSGAPAHLLETVIERLGLYIVYDDLGRRHGELDLDRGCIRINSNLFDLMHHNTDLNAVERFTLAHELAHVSLHPWRLQQGLPLTAAHEREAHFYAGVLLMPRRQIQATYEWEEWLHLKDGQNPWPIIYRLAERYQVSGKAMKVRLDQLAKVGPYVERPGPMPPLESLRSNVVQLFA